MSDQIDFEDLKEVIKSKVCVLVIGPDLIQADSASPGFYESFQTYLAGNKMNVQDYYLDEGFFYFSDMATRNQIRRQLSKFCEVAEKAALQDSESVYQKIARIPFDLILSFSPDLILENVFTHLKIDHAFHHYYPMNPTDQWAIGTEIGQKPVLINLVGRCDSSQEIILTHEDFIRYFSGMYGHNKLPQELTEIFRKNSVSQFIILGYRYEKWHYKLLLDKINFPGDDGTMIIKTASCRNTAVIGNMALTNSERKYYETKFLTSFCSDFGTKEFIDKLYEAFDEDELRKPMNEEQSKEAVVKTLLAQIKENCLAAKLESAVTRLKKLMENVEGPMLDLITGIIYDYNAAQNRVIGDKKLSEKVDRDSGLPEDEAKSLTSRILKVAQAIENQLKSASSVT